MTVNNKNSISVHAYIDDNANVRYSFKKKDEDKAIFSIACKILPKKQGLFSKIGELFLTMFNWKFVRINDPEYKNVVVNINSVAEKTGLTKDEVRKHALAGTLFTYCNQKASEILAKNINNQRINDIKAKNCVIQNPALISGLKSIWGQLRENPVERCWFEFSPSSLNNLRFGTSNFKTGSFLEKPKDLLFIDNIAIFYDKNTDQFYLDIDKAGPSYYNHFHIDTKKEFKEFISKSLN